MATLKKELADQGYSVELVVVSPTGWQEIIAAYQKLDLTTTTALGAVAIDEKTITALQESITDIKALGEKITATTTSSQLLELLMAGAIKLDASDIHTEPTEQSVRIRYRLDGMLHDIGELAKDNYHSLLDRVKINAGLKINIHEAPQDGRFTVNFTATAIEIRTSILPGAYGENIVMRLLNPKAVRHEIKDLGLNEEQLKTITRLLEKTTGAILTTGPTGSGKTTSLYAFLNSVNQPDIKIITIEDPVEYHLPGISQTQVNDEKGYSFASGLRSIVRQDPDVILVGEIRDRETAEIAMQASLTGHLVLSTLHTNDAAGAIPRLLDLGVHPETIGPALNAVLAQRLVRRLCDKCKQKKTITPEDYAVIKTGLAQVGKAESLPAFSESSEVFYPVGCAECNFTGFKGRIAIFEIFLVDEAMEKLIMQTPITATILEQAIKQGMLTMAQDGFIKVLAGITTVAEVERVVA
ncbi:MAG: hypothetical protein UX31_C0035G0004 [Candidatus Nomurabacteria bacterium GW2011_GWA1_46_11]|uniref:Bacterial type II secretion system protein E domain-containing protein n=1 Tax=Candidatus Nomurabacteria bacterium GW2011_GWA1_46_11 TaxID=1618732 RepID=A0A0G1RI18_9BACT|nr:MAG: hypothetical protein UX31_C0035G0004 [Candidatus Nomurabacteria bacterium GW2011_GWA1_46_11]